MADEIATLAAHLSAATARWLALIAEFDASEGWAACGCKSCAAWLSWRCGVAPLTAREHVRVARRLRELPVVAAAFGRGELSYSKVRALTRVEEVEDEPELVSLARHATAGQLERIVRGYRSVLAVEEGADRAFVQRSVTWSWEDDGTLVLRGRLAGEQGALLVAALEAARDALGPPPPDALGPAPPDALGPPPLDALGPPSLDALGPPPPDTLGPPPLDALGPPPPDALGPPPPEHDGPAGVSAETPEPDEVAVAGRPLRVAARNADALLRLAESSLAAGDAGANADRYMVVVHVDAQALACAPGTGGPPQRGAARASNSRRGGQPAVAGADAGSVRSGPAEERAAARCPAGERGTARCEPDAGVPLPPAMPRCELDAGVPLPPAVARRLACDGSLVRVIERDGRPLSVGRRTRAIAPALRRALRARDRGCVFPGCTQTGHLDAHHVQHWADGGRTEVENLVQLCRHHHRLLHEGGFSMRREGTRHAFFAPDGRRLAPAPRPPRGDGARLLADNWRAGLHVSAETPASLGRGQRMDLGLAVDALLQIAVPRRE